MNIYNYIMVVMMALPFALACGSEFSAESEKTWDAGFAGAATDAATDSMEELPAICEMACKRSLNVSAPLTHTLPQSWEDCNDAAMDYLLSFPDCQQTGANAVECGVDNPVVCMPIPGAEKTWDGALEYNCYEESDIPPSEPTPPTQEPTLTECSVIGFGDYFCKGC